MEIFLHFNNQQHGPHSVENVNQLLAQGQVPVNALAWYHGISAWVPLIQVPGIQLNQGETPPPPPPPITSNDKPDYQYVGLNGFYLAINLTDKTLTIKGATRAKAGADIHQVLPFDAIRGARTFVDDGFFLKTQGIELEINDLNTPVIRVVMNSRDQSLWMARIGQVCNMTNIR